MDELLEWFPDGRVVHCMRDPRAIYVSELRRRAEHAVGFPYRQLAAVPALLARFVLLEVVWAWARAVHRHRQLSRRYPDRYRLVRFEDVVFEYMLNALRLRLAACGVAGIIQPEVGGSGDVLKHNLIKELIATNTITSKDLELIDDPAGP